MMAVQGIMTIAPVTPLGAAEQGVAAGAKSFQEMLNQAITSVDNVTKEAEQKAAEVATGNASSFHEAVIASEKALLALQLTAAVQNKVVDAYNEMMRIQV